MQKKVQEVVDQLFGSVTTVELTRPEPQFGDFATNVALQLAKPLGKNPREIAEMVASALQETGDFSEVSVAGPGFINIRLSDEVLLAAVTAEAARPLAGQLVVAEYSDPNPFKVLLQIYLAVAKYFELK
jgi:arginyl-tRNA synthetase